MNAIRLLLINVSVLTALWPNPIWAQAGSTPVQSATAAELAAPSDSSNANVSSEQKDVKVPNVVGLPVGAAKAALEKVDLKVGSIEEESSTTIVTGLIISQHPRADTTVREHRRVRLVVSKGPPQDTVPNVVDATQAAATTAINSAGLKVGAVTLQSSATVALDHVVSESPTAGTHVVVGSAVNLVVSSGAPKVVVPNVVGLAQAAASTNITSDGLVVGAISMQSSATVAAGLVIGESPAAGTSVAHGTAVNLIVSIGSPKVAVPNVVGLTLGVATSAITGIGLTLGTVTLQSSTAVIAGLVISESPSAGSTVAANAAVSLVVSSGVAKVAVPNVVGMTQAAATTAITKTGLTVGTVAMQSSATVAAGLVIGESPAAGTGVAFGSAVNLVISSGVTLSSITVSPNSSSLLLNARQQFDAVGVYSDGSTKDISNVVTWASSAPGIAGITSTGALSGLSAGGAQITANLGSIQGIASVTIETSSTGFTLIPDLTDSRLMLYTNSDGSIATYYGLRDSTGLPARIDSVLVSFPDNTSESILLDAQSRPTLLTLSSGGQISLNWTSSTSAILTALSPDGTAQITTNLNVGGNTTGASSGALANIQEARVVANTTAANSPPNNQQASVRVTNCGQSEDGATVFFTKGGLLGGAPIPATAIGGGSGAYYANFPAGIGNINLGSVGNAAAATLNTACDALTEVQQLGLTPPVTLNAEVCLAVTVAIDAGSFGLTLAGTAAIQGLCTATGLGLAVVQNACKAQSTVSNTTSFLNYLNANQKFSIQATAQAPGTAMVASYLDNAGPQGAYQVPNIALNCPVIASVSVSPPVLSLQEGLTAPVTAEVINDSGQLVQSSVSAYAPTWAGTPSNEVSVVANPAATTSAGSSVGPAAATVTAGNTATSPGAPALVTATVPNAPGSPSVSGSAQVTVTAPALSPVGNWTLAAQNGISIQSCQASPENCYVSGSIDINPDGTVTNNVYCYYANTTYTCFTQPVGKWSLLAASSVLTSFSITYPNGYVDSSGLVQVVNGQLQLQLAAELAVFE